ncbi:FAD-binding oxidoreductase [Seohaeicola saemankumensis]|nr:FAD-binding oxidoreductase [Seohaeicola saemankumensis]MCA0873256.1 FAD-binding oxidoreductase [Seohaeicola saemankumensis]
MTAEVNLWQLTCAEQIDAPPLDRDLTVDLVVIGGGFTGCSAALHAAQDGARVALVEAQQIGHGGSGRNVGLANAGLWLPPDDIRAHMGQGAGDRLIGLLAGAPDLVFALIDRHAITCEPMRSGTLHCAHSAKGLKDLQNRHAQLAATGAPVRLLAADETARRTGSDRFHGALFDPRAGTIQPLAYARGLARAAMAAGAGVHQNTPAQSVTREGDLWCVVTPGGTIRAKSLLLATNAYHCGASGLPAPQYTTVGYFQLATAPLNDTQRAAILPGGEGCWDTGLIMSSFRIDAAGRLILGAMGDLSHPAAGMHRAWAARKLARLFPDLAGVPLTHVWCGHIAMTSDHLPKVLRLGPGALSVFGYSGRGIGPGTLFGRNAAQALMAGDDRLLPVAPVDTYGEGFTGLRRAYYETGAVLTHALRARAWADGMS